MESSKEEEYPKQPRLHLCLRCGPLVDPIFQVYFLLSLAQFLLYTETGAVPALLVELTRDFNLSFPEQGYLGGMVYAGIAIGSPFTSVLVSFFEARTVLLCSIALNAGFTILFGFTPLSASPMLITLRGFIGITQATLAVFAPVWVDKFASIRSKGKWFALLQITIPLGIMFGYLLGWATLQFVATDGQECFYGTFACWRLPFLLQGVLQVPLCLLFYYVAPAHLDIGPQAVRRKSIDSNGGITRLLTHDIPVKKGTCGIICQYFRDICTIVSQFYFTTVVIVITCMYFVIISIQYWATAWLISRGYPENDVRGWFVFCAVTGPVLGAIFGGWLIDYIGGFGGSVNQRSYVTGVLFMLGGIASTFSIITTMWKELGFAWVVFGMWAILFTGSSTIPTLVGMYVAAIPSQRLKILGSSLMMVIVSIFAYFLCPVVTGYIMRSFAKELPECKGLTPGRCPAALEGGFRWSLYMTPVAQFFLLLVWIGGCFMKGDRLINRAAVDLNAELKVENGELKGKAREDQLSSQNDGTYTKIHVASPEQTRNGNGNEKKTTYNFSSNFDEGLEEKASKLAEQAKSREWRKQLDTAVELSPLL